MMLELCGSSLFSYECSSVSFLICLSLTFHTFIDFGERPFIFSSSLQDILGRSLTVLSVTSCTAPLPPSGPLLFRDKISSSVTGSVEPSDVHGIVIRRILGDVIFCTIASSLRPLPLRGGRIFVFVGLDNDTAVGLLCSEVDLVDSSVMTENPVSASNDTTCAAGIFS